MSPVKHPFYCVINILARRKDVQGRIWTEIRSDSFDPVGYVNLGNRNKMPCSRSITFELLRHHSVMSGGIHRLIVKGTTVAGISLLVALGASAVFNICTLHNDPKAL